MRQATAPWSTAPLLGVMVASAIFTLGEGSLNVVLSPHLEARGMPRGAIGVAVAGFSVAALVTRFVAGSAYRRRRARWQIPAGCACAAASFLGLASARSPAMLSALIALNGVGFGVVSTAGLAAIMDLRPDTDAGSLMGWYTGAIGGGYAVAGFLGGLAGDALGLEQAIRVLAFAPTVAGVVMLLALRNVGREEGQEPTAPRVPGARLASFRGLGPVVWLAFALALHINLLGGMLITYFPLYGLAIGLSLTQIGILSGVHSSVSSLIRFGTPLIFARVDHRALTTPLVVIGGFAVASLAWSPSFTLLLLAWLVIGASRGVIRVSSAALVMEASSASSNRAGARGPASGVYLAGLDIGKIIGPLVGGVVVEGAGLATAFVIAGLGFPLVFLVLGSVLRRSSEGSA